MKFHESDLEVKVVGFNRRKAEGRYNQCKLEMQEVKRKLRVLGFVGFSLCGNFIYEGDTVKVDEKQNKIPVELEVI